MGWDLTARELITALAVRTKRSVERLIADRIWLLTGTGRPRAYLLCATFVVTRTSHDKQTNPNIAIGDIGTVFNPFILLEGG
jgi:hypothetical protein